MTKAYSQISLLISLFVCFVVYGVISAPNAGELGLFLVFVLPIVGGICTAWCSCIYKGAKKHQKYEEEAKKQEEYAEENYRSGKWAIDINAVVVDVEYDVNDNNVVEDVGYVYTAALVATFN